MTTSKRAGEKKKKHLENLQILHHDKGIMIEGQAFSMGFYGA
ncbi:MAG: hypothetical protein WCH43_09365 [Verrucomicrobiota bacterium]